MEKYGQVQLKESNVKYDIVWSTNERGQYERLDVIEHLDDYNVVDTSNCVAAFYRKQIERYLGDVELIKRILRTKSAVIMHNAPVTQSFKAEDGQVIISQVKEDARIGIKSETCLVGGTIVKEYYETNDTIILISSVNREKSMEIKPINLSDYTSYSVSEDKYIKLSGTLGDYYSLDYLKRIYPLDHIEDYDFVVVDSMETAVARLDRWAKADTKVKAIDLETTGLEWYMLGQDVITGIVLSYNENESTYYPFRQENFEYNLPISFIQTILDTIAAQPKDVKIIGHNAKVEIQGIWKEDVHYVKNSEYATSFDPDWEKHALHDPQLRIDGDSFILSLLVNPVFKEGLHSLKSLAYKVRKKYFLELDDVFKSKKGIKFNVLPKEIVRYYACPDTANTIAVWNYLMEQIPKDELGILDLESKIIDITACNEFYGMRVKKGELVKAIENEEYKCKVLGDLFRGIHKTNKNIDSPQVRADIFYNKLRAPVEVRTNTGAPSTSKFALKRIVELGTLSEYDESRVPKPITDINGKVVIKGEELASNKYPSLVVLQKYAECRKELGALKRIDRKSVRDRVIFRMNQVGTATGRASSDAHQYSDAMKKVVVSDTDDYWLWSADYKQVELRILAYLAGQEDLIKLESDKDVDVHRAILSIITGKPMWAISAEERKRGKSTNFGVVYMMSAFGLARRNAGPKYTEDDLIAAMESINGFYNGLPAIKKFVKNSEIFVREHGYMRTAMGRYRYFPGMQDPEVSEKQKASWVRAANNMPVQGFGADLLKIAMCNCKEYIHEKGWDEKVESHGLYLPKVRLMLSIHDELLVSTHKSIPIEEIITMFKICMEIKIKGAPPFFSAPAMVTSWYDGKLDQYELDLGYRDQIVEEWADNHKRILHSNTYCDDYDWVKVDEINRWCKDFRRVLLTESDYVNGKLAVQESTIDKALATVSSSELEMLVNHFISSDESFTAEEKKRVAIQRAFDPNYSHYLEDLTRFRSKKLKSYMDGLIAKYKTVDAVAEHVQHPELTHTLIAVELTKEDKLDHISAIKEATRRYMEKAEQGVTEGVQTVGTESEKVEGLRDYEELEEYIEFNDEGEVVLDEDVEEKEEEDNLDDVERVENESVLVADKPEREFAVYTMSDVIIDLSEYSVTDERAERINQAIGKMSSKSRPYRVCYYICGRLIPTQLYVDYVPAEINAVIRGCA